MASNVQLVDGSFDFSDGVDSGRVETIRSELTPHGLKRSNLAWATNASMRGGGITCVTGCRSLCTVPSTGLYQGGWLYDASHQGANPNLVLKIGGQVYQIRVDTNNAVTNITGGATPHSATQPVAHFCQGEEFLVIQAGDGVTLPLFWDGTTMRNAGAGEIPAATCMDYYMGRIWYAKNRDYVAGDIVRGGSGSAPYNFRDSILKVTESPLATGADGFSDAFTVPTQTGNIRAIAHTANLDTALGQGSLFVFTRKAVYRLNVPVTRTEWKATTNADQALQTVVQKVSGAYGDRCLTHENGDLFYQAPDGIRSLILSIRDFTQWGNTPISRNLNRAIRFNDRSLMRFASATSFNNQTLHTILPAQQARGVVFKGIAVLDFDLLASLGEKIPPAWNGMLEGLDVLQLFSGDFGGLERCFAAVISRDTGDIQVWELTSTDRFNDADKAAPLGDKRIDWFFETPAWTWGKEFELKRLTGGEVWFDKVFGTVDLTFYWRVDANPCWQFWHQTTICAARTCTENVDNPVCYPEQAFREGSKLPVTLPDPPYPKCENMNKRPMNIGYQFQMKVVVKGWCRCRGFLLNSVPVQHAPYAGLNG